MSNRDDSLDHTALTALLLRHAEAFFENEFLKERIEGDRKRIAELAKRMADCETSFRVFGYDVKQDGVWDSLIDPRLKDLQPYLHDIQAKYPLKPTQKATVQPAELPAPEQLPIHQMVLDRLKEAGVSGSKAAPIRAHIEAILGRQIHEKTVGMTLYRLLKQGVVRRDGHTWFFVPQNAVAMNPGVQPPGLFNRDTKEGEEL